MMTQGDEPIGDRKQRITIAHAHASRENVGDDALVLAIRHQISNEHGGAIDFVSIALDDRQGADEEQGRFLPLYSLPHPRLWPRALITLRQCSAIVVGGGELIGGSDFLIFPALAKALGIPCVYVGVGADFVRASRLPRALTRRLLPIATRVFVRDPAAIKEIEEVCGAGAVSLKESVDPVFSLGTSRTGPATPKTGIGVILRDTERVDRALTLPRVRNLASAVDRIAGQRDEEVHLFPFVPSAQEMAMVSDAADEVTDLEMPRSDPAILNRFAEYLSPSTSVVIHPPLMSPASIIRAFGGLRGVVTMRLHGAILSALAGTPFVALAYANKIDRVLATMACDGRSLRMATLDEEQALAQALRDQLREFTDSELAAIAELRARATRDLEHMAATIVDQSTSSRPSLWRLVPAWIVLATAALITTYNRSRSGVLRSLLARIRATSE